MSSSFSFKIAPPPRPSSSSNRPPASRASGSRSYHNSHNNDEEDSSDDEGAFGGASRRVRDEAITGFDSNGATSQVKEKKAAPLVIPSLGNKDWRAEAEKKKRGGAKRREMYIPDAVGSMRVGGPAPGVGADGSQGGLGTTDTINDAPVVGGLAMPDARPASAQEDVEMDTATTQPPPPPPPTAAVLAPETDEQRAYRELLAGNRPSSQEQEQHTIAPASANTFAGGPQDETSAFRDDVLTRPDEPDLDAYARVPVGQFGAALLRGMGWKEGTAASRTGRKGLTEAYVPKSRPAMLGIGAKPMAEVMGGEEKDRNGRVIRRNPRDELRFVPLVKREREGSASASGRSTPQAQLTNGSSQAPSRSGSNTPLPSSSSRPRSRSPPPSASRHSSSRPSGYSDRDRSDRDRSDRDRYRDRDGSSSHRSRSHRERSRSPRRDDRDRREYSSRDDRGSSRREGDEGRSDRRDREHRDRDRDYRDRDRERERRRD